MTTEMQTFNTESLVTFMQDTMGVNPFTIYCQLTGKPIGRIDSDELSLFLVPGADVEQVADDLFVRIIASMRPSIHWNVMREDSLTKLAVSRPNETLAYLLNRLFQPNDYWKRSRASILDDQHQRIKLFSFIESMNIEKRESLYSMLIEIDAKMNLSQQFIDLRPVDFMLFFNESFAAIEAFYADCMKRWARQQKAELDSARWFKGNTVARPAFVKSFLEAKPESKTAAKKRVRRQEDDELDALFHAVIDAAEANPTPKLEVAVIAAATPTSTVTRKVPAFLIRKAN